MAKTLDTIPILCLYDMFFKLQLADHIKEVVLNRDDFVIREGDEAKSFYIILDGTVEVLKSYED